MPAARFDKSKKPYSRPNRPRRSEGDWVHDKAPESNNIRTPRAPASTANGTVGNSKLLVSNLHYEVTPKDLTQIFGQVGTLVREPLIRYDRSGRSSGVAVIFFETASDAKKALEQFDQKLCKGQPMSITFDSGPPARQSRRASAPSLINRIQKPPLAERLGTAETKAAPAAASSNSAGPIRNKGGQRAPKEPKKPKNTPKTAEELDMELDAFMKDDSKPAAAPPVQPAPTAQTEDVDMAA